ncbi:MAG: RNA-binding cell elongation regulator Jag/EloR [Acidimicrobiales bacterium]
MEWVETTGKTVDEAKDAALDQLGVDEQDAEFEVVEEPRTGLFGRSRGDARVRARVRPTQPRPKVERRDRRGKASGRGAEPGERRRGGGDEGRAGGATATKPSKPAAVEHGRAEAGATAPAEDQSPARAAAPLHRNGRSRDRGRSGRAGRDTDDEQESINMSDTELAEQGEVVRGFLVDLLDAFGLDGEVTATPAEEGAVELAVVGDDLGLLIGPKGATLQAVQELSRSVLQRQLPGETHARIRVDVSGYRARRKEALEGFVRTVAEDVVRSGTRKALEPMAPPDRKVVHDTVNDIDGVHTISEGEDARRRVVLIPDA